MPKNHTFSTAAFDTAAYGQLVADAKKRVHSGQLAAWRAVNKELINLYWDLGRLIVERQQAHGWGNSVVEMLAKDLQAAFPRMRGLSASNLWRARAFYTIYQDDEILAPITREIGWTHNYTIFEKCKDTNERHFYLLMTKRFGWTINVLIHQIENQAFEKTVIGQTNFEEKLPENLKAQAILAVKDEYAFDFLELGDQHSEYQLEQAILQNIRQFLVEMGGDFCFIANQFPLELSGKDYRVDLLLYHRELQSLVAIDLKIGEFEPEHTGNMSFYLSLLDDRKKKAARKPQHRHHHLQKQGFHHGRICTEGCQQTHWRSYLQHHKITAQGATCIFPCARRTYQAGGNRD